MFGDLNFHLENLEKSETLIFCSFLDEFSLKQLIQEPTHNKNHTLDVLITREDSKIISSFQVKDPYLCNSEGIISNDHYAILTTLSITKPQPKKKVIKYRDLKNVDIEIFTQKLLASDLMKKNVINKLDSNKLVDLYNTSLQEIIDSLAPLQTKVILPRKNAIKFTKDLHLLKRKRRQAERLWRKTGNPDHLQLFKSSCTVFTKAVELSCRKQTSELITDAGTDQKKLFKITNKLLARKINEAVLPN